MRISIICNQFDVIMLYGILSPTNPVSCCGGAEIKRCWMIYCRCQCCPVAVHQQPAPMFCPSQKRLRLIIQSAVTSLRSRRCMKWFDVTCHAVIFPQGEPTNRLQVSEIMDVSVILGPRTHGQNPQVININYNWIKKEKTFICSQKKVISNSCDHQPIPSNTSASNRGLHHVKWSPLPDAMQHVEKRPFEAAGDRRYE